MTSRYSRPVSLNGAPVVGDLFAQVEVSFALSITSISYTGRLLPTSAFSGVLSSRDFTSDLDTVTYAITPVPEPGTLALMLAGLGAVGVVARRRESAAA